MADKKFNEINIFDEDDDDSGSGQAGGIEFHDFLRPEKPQGLTREEQKRALIHHADKNRENVKRQKDKRDYYRAIKDKKIQKNRQGQGLGMGHGAANGMKAHMLSKTVQFGSGVIENTVNSLPSEHVAETNAEQAEELQYQLQNRLTNTPHSTPKPRPSGT